MQLFIALGQNTSCVYTALCAMACLDNNNLFVVMYCSLPGCMTSSTVKNNCGVAKLAICPTLQGSNYTLYGLHFSMFIDPTIVCGSEGGTRNKGRGDVLDKRYD